jgi:hypothetical protein
MRHIPAASISPSGCAGHPRKPRTTTSDVRSVAAGSILILAPSPITRGRCRIRR